MRRPGTARDAGVALWVAFALVHVGLTWLGVVVAPASSFADVDLYRWWVHLGLDHGYWPVLDEPWVYPAGALAPMILPGLATTWSTTAYAVGWCALVTALDAAATLALVTPVPAAARAARTAGGDGRGAAHGDLAHGSAPGPTRVSTAGAWWWLGFLALLGPVAVGRLDAVVAPLMVVALVSAVRRPAVASALLALGAWIKIAPGALLLPVLAAARRPVRDVVLPAAAVCVVVVGAVAAGGGLANIASFLTTQTSRGLQVESVGATGWVLARLVRGTPDITVELNETLVTWEVHGPGTTAAAGVLDVLLVLAVAAVAGALWLARAEGRAREALLPAALTVLLALVVTNKVGSPQFLAWLAAPIAVALSRPGEAGRRWSRRAGAVALVAAALTQVVFPWGYGHLLAGDPVVSVVLAARNVALVALLAIAARGLAAVIGGRPRPDVPVAAAADDDARVTRREA